MRISFAVKDICRYLGLGRYAGYTQGSSEYSVKSLTEREVHPQQGGPGKKVAGEQGTMRTPLYSPHSLSRPGKGGGHHHGNNKSGEANPYSSLPYATYRRPAPGVPPSFASPPTANDFNSHHFQTFGRHECFAAPCPITSMSRPDLLMSQTTVGWEGGCRGPGLPTSSTQLKATPTTGLNLQISCISTQQQQAPLATRVSLSKERLAETRCSIIIKIIKIIKIIEIIKIIISIIIIMILPDSLCLPTCSSAGLRLLTAVNPLTHPS